MKRYDAVGISSLFTQSATISVQNEARRLYQFFFFLVSMSVFYAFYTVWWFVTQNNVWLLLIQRLPSNCMHSPVNLSLASAWPMVIGQFSIEKIATLYTFIMVINHQQEEEITPQQKSVKSSTFALCTTPNQFGRGLNTCNI